MATSKRSTSSTDSKRRGGSAGDEGSTQITASAVTSPKAARAAKAEAVAKADAAAKAAEAAEAAHGEKAERAARTARKAAKNARKADQALVEARRAEREVQQATSATRRAKSAKKRARQEQQEAAEVAEQVRERSRAAVEKTAASQQQRAEPADLRELLRVGEQFALGDVDPRSTPGFEAGKAEGRRALADDAAQLADLQERLFAEGRSGGGRSVLLVVQGMDTSGKGGIVRHVVGAVDPQGVDHTSFGPPTDEELANPFLWRIRQQLPRPGQIGVFDRSHYEDVLVVAVHDLVPPQVWKRRYATINRFERSVVEGGTAVVKVMLHISQDEQRERLLERLDRPDKHWKFEPGDVDERQHWDDYAQAYQAALTRCSSDEAPWYVVPADRKWYARWAVQQLLLRELQDLDPQWPEADFDVDQQRVRLLET